MLLSPEQMKAFLVLLLSVAAIAMVAAIFVFDVFSELRVTGTQRVPFASAGMSREQYIAYLLRTERHDDPELWCRIAAVQNLKPWPK